MSEGTKAAFPGRSDWNRRGPYVSLWFRRRLRMLDPGLVLQYMPPRSLHDPNGVPPDVYPHGVWDIRRKLPRSGCLSPVAVWSLADSNGCYSPPGADTLKLLQTALYYHRSGRVDLMERLRDEALDELNKARASGSRKRLYDAMSRFASKNFDRHRANRVFLRREVPKVDSG